MIEKLDYEINKHYLNHSRVIYSPHIPEQIFDKINELCEELNQTNEKLNEIKKLIEPNS